MKSEKNCEGLHDGRWYICTILSQKGDRYKVTFDGWSRQFDTVLSADCLRPCTMIDVRSRKRWRPSVNFNKLLPGDEVLISIEGIRKPAVVRVVDPFQELVTVECGKKKTHCFSPRCTTTARTTHSWYCQEEKTSSYTSSSASSNNTTSRIGACPCSVSHSPAVRDDRSPWWYQNQLWRSCEPHPEQCRRRLHCPGALPRRVRLRGSPKCSEVPAVRWCRRTPSCKLQADLPSIRGTHTSRH